MQKHLCSETMIVKSQQFDLISANMHVLHTLIWANCVCTHAKMQYVLNLFNGDKQKQ